MRNVQEALQDILRDFSRLEPESVLLMSALGRSLAEDVAAANDLPLFDNSSMDGYAVQAADLASLPAQLTVIGDTPAGTYPDFTVAAGQAARIMTGAPLPPGADVVIPVEQTDDERRGQALPAQVEIRAAHDAGAYIRRRGEDVKTGQIVLQAGHVLRPQDLGLLAGLGVAQVPAVRRPRVAILSTGDELLTPDMPPSGGKIRDMNSYSLHGMVLALGAEPIPLGIAGDTEAAVRQKLTEALAAGADVILSSAGVSVGTYDVVKSVLEAMGAIGFWKVNMRPGKPLAYGHVEGVPFFGVPGNPVSALASFEIFVRPAILTLLGRDPHVPTLSVQVGEDMTSDGRESYIRVTLRRENGSLIAKSTGTQSSGAISSLVNADALLIIPSGVKTVALGDTLQARPFAGQALWL